MSKPVASLVDDFGFGVAGEEKAEAVEGVKGVLEQWQGAPWPNTANIRPLLLDLPLAANWSIRISWSGETSQEDRPHFAVKVNRAVRAASGEAIRNPAPDNRVYQEGPPLDQRGVGRCLWGGISPRDGGP